MTWAWKTGPVEYKERCVGCNKPLRSEAGPFVVYLGADYHVGCLLDHLCAAGPKTLDVNFDAWGGGGMLKDSVTHRYQFNKTKP